MRAKLALAQLEAEDRISPARRLIDDLPLFCAAGLAATQAVQDPALNALVAAFAALNPDELLRATRSLRFTRSRSISPACSGRNEPKS